MLAVTIRLIESTETHLFCCLNFFFSLFFCFAQQPIQNMRIKCDGSKPNKTEQKTGKEHDSIGYFHLCIENVGFIKNPHVYKMIIILDLEIKLKKMNASSQQHYCLYSSLLACGLFSSWKIVHYFDWILNEQNNGSNRTMYRTEADFLLLLIFFDL